MDRLHSRVRPQFNGDIITSPRSQVYFLATEYGVVNLEGRSTWERAEALVSIAHPAFRDYLIKEAEKKKNLEAEQPYPLRGYRKYSFFSSHFLLE